MRLTGRVKWFNNGSGRGVIQPDQGEAVPVEAAAIRGSGLAGLEAGQPVRFEVTRGPDGLHANRVIPIHGGAKPVADGGKPESDDSGAGGITGLVGFLKRDHQ